MENNCQAGHKKHDTLEVDTALGKMTVFDWEKYKDQFNTYCPGQDALSQILSVSRHWEHRLYIGVKKILQNGDKDNLVIDVGAHIGWYSKMAMNYGYKVVAFEGNPENIEVLALNAPGTEIHPVWFDENLKKVFRTNKVIEFMKIDIEGAEEHAIHYFRKVLLQTKNILMEVSPTFNDSYPALLKKMVSLGFEVFESDGSPFDFDYKFTQKDLFLKKNL